MIFPFLDLITCYPKPVMKYLTVLQIEEYCGQKSAAVGRTDGEVSQLVLRNVNITRGYMLQFFINIGCGQASNISVPPVDLHYSTDHGVSWLPLYLPCVEDGGTCLLQPQASAAMYAHPWPHWERIIVPLYGLPTSE